MPGQDVRRKNAIKQAQRYLASGAPVGPYLTDQLLIPMAMAGGGRFRAVSPTMHTKTNIEVIKAFLDVTVDVTEISRDLFEIEIKK